MAWLNPDAMIARLEAEIDAAPVAVGGLGAAERAERERELAAQILDAERAEESLIEQALAQETIITRRPRANPLAVLGVARAA